MIEGLKMIPLLILLLCIGGMIAASTAVVNAQFRSSTTNANAQGIIDNSSAGIGNMASNFGTMGTIGAMVIIISMLGSAMVYFRYFQ